MRSEIQALRAFAIVVVIAYHFWPQYLTGGFIGVDVFFVISGFLISRHILDQVRTETFSFVGFYARRIRRIFPAALVVLIFCVVGVLTVSSVLDWQNYSAQTSISALFGENWFLSALSVDYLGATANQSPVQHYWSLSVEEQFYLAWPVFLVLAVYLVALRKPKDTYSESQLRRAPEIALFAIVLIVAIASFALSAWLVVSDPVPSFFNTFGRIWEFALGTLAAIGLRNKVLPCGLRIILAFVGWLALALAALLFTDTMPFPGPFALIPTIATMSIIAAGSFDERSSTRWIYGNRLILFIAAVSFSAYLWHWPLLVFSQRVFQDDLSASVLISLVAVTFLLAWLTTRFVENPIRFSRRRPSPRRVVVFGLAAAVAVAMIAFIPWVAIERVATSHAANQGSPSGPTESTAVPSGPAGGEQLCRGAQAVVARDSCIDGPYVDIVPNILEAKGPISYLQTTSPKCAATRVDEENYSCVFGNPQSDIKVALVGDSKAMKMFPALEVLAMESDWSLTVFLRGACAWYQPDGQDNPCEEFRREVTTELTTTRWDAVFIAAAASASRPEDDFRKPWKLLTALGTPVIVIRDNPNFDADPRVCILDAESNAELDACAGQRSLVVKKDMAAEVSASMENVYLLDFSDIYCDASRCPVMIGGIYVYRDKSHINDEFSRTLAPVIQKQLQVEVPSLFVNTTKSSK